MMSDVEEGEEKRMTKNRMVKGRIGVERRVVKERQEGRR